MKPGGNIMIHDLDSPIFDTVIETPRKMDDINQNTNIRKLNLL